MSSERPVHNHGPEDGPGLACRESLIGDCLRFAAPAAAPGDGLRALVDGMLANADARRDSINGPEDAAVQALCERWGYGAVMDAAARLWQRKNPIGAFVTGPCRGTLTSLLAAAATPAPTPRPVAWVLRYRGGSHEQWRRRHIVGGTGSSSFWEDEREVNAEAACLREDGYEVEVQPVLAAAPSQEG